MIVKWSGILAKVEYIDMPLSTRFADIYNQLEQWAQWQRGDRGARGYPKVSSGFSQVSTTRSTGYSITDEQAGVIDGLVAKLKKKDSDMGNVVESYFIY